MTTGPYRSKPTIINGVDQSILILQGLCLGCGEWPAPKHNTICLTCYILGPLHTFEDLELDGNQLKSKVRINE